ncbi:MAG: 2Fe-2S iron-sulfur cluster binding domain-containing protein [Deltaproteobacteria bacterium]|nr:2Fe-2S iron-sulfur cluster binding domain-containing protein [Deltaproteobacteria bacterium]
MRNRYHRRSVFSRLRVAVVCLGLAVATPGYSQVSPSEHEAHHPGQGQTAPVASPPASPGAAGNMGQGMGEMMKGMGEMMKGMGMSPRKELYPSLMELPELPPERRVEMETLAHERMLTGTALLSSGLDQLAQATAQKDYSAMQKATAQVRFGLAQFESGLAAHRALADGKGARDVALQWFQRTMSLAPAADDESPREIFGLSWFHYMTMVLLTAFAITMIWMYFHKMRRATQLLQSLTGGIPLAPTTATVAAALGQTSPPVSGLASPLVPVADGAFVPAQPGKWLGKLRVGRIFQETPDVKTFRLMNPLGGVLPFAYLPGQFLTVTVTPDGKLVKRGYTIASSPTQHDYVEITVKHEEGGVVSGFLHARVQEGDLLEFSGPSGSFIFTGRECRCILLIGGGVGITPLMSVLRYLTDRAWPGDIFLMYGCKSPRDIIFREELDYLQRRHPNLRVVIVVSHAEGTDWKGPTGFITKELISQSVPDIASRYVHICGPVPMMEAAKKILAELGVPKERVKTEAFGLAMGKPEPTMPLAELPLGKEEKAAQIALPVVTFSLSNKSAPFAPDKVILDVADEIGVEIDNSCRVGTCGTCRVKLLAGQVTMAVENGLEPGDKEQGIILACQAKSTGNVTVEA